MILNIHLKLIWILFLKKFHAENKNGYPPQGIHCQKCLEYGHWTYECTGKRKYLHRESRTQQLKKKMKVLENSDNNEANKTEQAESSDSDSESDSSESSSSESSDSSDDSESSSGSSSEESSSSKSE